MDKVIITTFIKEQKWQFTVGDLHSISIFFCLRIVQIRSPEILLKTYSSLLIMLQKCTSSIQRGVRTNFYFRVIFECIICQQYYNMYHIPSHIVKAY